MPAVMTFTSLVSDLQSYLEKGDATTDTLVFNQFQELINFAERRMARDLKITGFINPMSSTLAAGVAVYPKPAGWLRTASINIGTGTNFNVRTPLLPRSYEYIRNYWRDDSIVEQPRFYADYDFQHFLIGPTPDAAYPMEVLSYQQPRLLDTNNQRNWLTDNAPQALLYAALAEAALFLKNDDRLQGIEAKYQQALQSLSAEDMQRVVDRTATRQQGS